MKASQIIEVIRRQMNLPVNLRRPIMIHGSPGVGKSAVTQCAAKLEQALCFVHDGSLLDPVDAGGLPDIQGAEVIYKRPFIAPPLNCGKALLVIDEIDKAVPLVQNTLLTWALARQAHGHKLSDDVTVIAIANKQTDGAHSQRLSTALNSRFIHLDFDVCPNDWGKYMLDSGKRAEVVAFTRFKSELFYAFDKNARTFPCPRTWDMVSDILDSGHTPENEQELIMGTVDNGAGAEFIAFLQTWRTLTNPDGILMNPDSAPVPSEPSTLYAIAGTLARRCTESTWPSIAKYAKRIPAEFGAFMVSDCVRRCAAIQQTRPFIDWSVANQGLMI